LISKATSPFVGVHGFKGLPAFGGAVGDQGSEVQGSILAPGLPLDVYLREKHHFWRLNPKFESKLAITWKNRGFYAGLRVFNSFFVLNPER